MKGKFILLGTVLLCILHLSCKDTETPVSVLDFQPTSGDFGTLVTINGSNFDTGNTNVYFGTTLASLISATSTQLQVKVPDGVTTGKILIKSKGRQITTSGDFEVLGGSWSSNGNFQSIPSDFYSAPMFVIGGNAYLHTSRRTVGGTPVDATFWSYDPVSHSSVQQKELDKSFSGSSFKSWASPSKGYMFSGYALSEYDPSQNSWASKAIPTSFPDRFALTISFYLSDTDKAYVLLSDKSVWVYSSSNNTWGRLPDLPFSPSSPRVACSSSKAYVINGNDFWLFDSGGLLWTPLKKFPGYNPNFILSLNNEIYVGSTSIFSTPSPSDGLWKYDSDNDDWILKASPPLYRTSPVYFSIGQKGYVGLGESGNFYVYDFYRYDPS